MHADSPGCTITNGEGFCHPIALQFPRCQWHLLSLHKKSTIKSKLKKEKKKKRHFLVETLVYPSLEPAFKDLSVQIRTYLDI